MIANHFRIAGLGVYKLRSGERISILVFFKTHIVPIGGETVPCLELLTVMILVWLINNVKQVLSKKLQIFNCIYWSDSQIALWWICNVNKILKSSIKNRVVEIGSLSVPSQWHYLSKQNPADMLKENL